MASIMPRATAPFGQARHVTFLISMKKRLASASRAHGREGSCMRQAKADVAYALSRSSRTEYSDERENTLQK